MGVMAAFIVSLLSTVSIVAAGRTKGSKNDHPAQLRPLFSEAQRDDQFLQVATATGCFFWEPECKASEALCGTNAIIFDNVMENQCQKFIYLWNHADQECSGPKHSPEEYQVCFWEHVNQWVPGRRHCDTVCADSHGALPKQIESCQLQCWQVHDCKDRCQGDAYKFKDSITDCLSDCMDESPVNPEGTCKGSCGTHSQNMECRCDPSCQHLNDCCKDYENYCLVGNLKSGEEIGAPELPEFNISAKDIKAFKGKYKVTAKPAPPLPAKENATTAGSASGAPASDAAAPAAGTTSSASAGTATAIFLQRQAYPEFESISDMLEPKIAGMAKRLRQIPSQISGSGTKLLQALEIFLGGNHSTNFSKAQAKARVDTLVHNLLAVKQQLKKAYQDPQAEVPPKNFMAVKRQSKKVHQDPPLVEPPPPPSGAPTDAVMEDQATAQEISAESSKLGNAVGEINDDVNDIFHLLEQAEYWHHKTPILKATVSDFASRYQASLHNLAVAAGLISGGPGGAPGGPGAAPSAAPAGHAPGR